MVIAGSVHPALADPDSRARLSPPPEPTTTYGRQGSARSNSYRPEEARRRASVRARCELNGDDPHCERYLEAEVARSIRQMEQAERKLYPDEATYCYDHPRDRGCGPLLRKQDQKDSQRSLTELRRYCQENPDTPRCTAFTLLDGVPAEAAKPKVVKKAEEGPLFSPDPSMLFGPGAGDDDEGEVEADDSQSSAPADPGEQLGIGEMLDGE